MRGALVVGTLGVVWWWWVPFPGPGADPVVDLIAARSRWLHEAIRAWHYLAPGVAVVGGWSVVQSIGRVWCASRRRDAAAGELPPWPLKKSDARPALVIGEVHHPVAAREVETPTWLTIPERGTLYRHPHLRRGRVGKDVGVHAAICAAAALLASQRSPAAHGRPGARGQGGLLFSGAGHPHGSGTRGGLPRARARGAVAMEPAQRPVAG